ncbi:MAG: hypothetical protein R2713_02730 [Ilumatobacteraceae bacterium]
MAAECYNMPLSWTLWGVIRNPALQNVDNTVLPDGSEFRLSGGFFSLGQVYVEEDAIVGLTGLGRSARSIRGGDQSRTGSANPFRRRRPEARLDRVPGAHVRVGAHRLDERVVPNTTPRDGHVDHGPRDHPAVHVAAAGDHLAVREAASPVRRPPG